MCAKSVPGVRIPISPPGNFKVVRKNNLFCFHKVDLPAGKLLESMLWGFEPERGEQPSGLFTAEDESLRSSKLYFVKFWISPSLRQEISRLFARTTFFVLFKIHFIYFSTLGFAYIYLVHSNKHSEYSAE